MAADRTRSGRSRIERRGVLALGAAGVAAGALGIAPGADITVHAQTSTKGLPQGAGFYRFKLGELACASVAEGVFKVDKDVRPTLAPDADPAAFEAAMRREFLPVDRARLSCNVLYVDTGRNKVLFDVGTGDVWGPSLGQLPANLANLGVRPEEIDTIVISHAHGDHLYGILDKQGALTFPNARCFVGETEWRFWTDASASLPRLRLPEEAKKRMIAGAQKHLAAIRDRVTLVADGQEVVPGVHALSAPGHTPGHTGWVVSSGTEQLLHGVDFAHYYAAVLPHPDWSPSFDADPALAAQTRRRLLDRMAADRALVYAYHFPFPGLGHIRAEGQGYAWVPVPWSWEP